MKQREDIVKTIPREFNAIKLRNARFSIIFDESTSVRNRRYININVHFQGGFRSLGMIRIQGSWNANLVLENWLKNDCNCLVWT